MNSLQPFSKALSEGGLEKLFTSRALENQWAEELSNLNRTAVGPRQPVTGNKQALEIAQAIHDSQRLALDGLRREGAWIGNYDGYVARTTHSPDRIRRMGADKWAALAQADFLDLDTIYPNRDAAFIDKDLRDQWQRIVTGVHEEYNPGHFEPISFQPGQNLAKKDERKPRYPFQGRKELARLYARGIGRNANVCHHAQLCPRRPGYRPHENVGYQPPRRVRG